MSYVDLEQAKVPGPGRYDEYRFNETPKWSMRPRTSSECSLTNNLVFPKTTVLEVPAPCTYDNREKIGKNPNGKYHLSRYRNSKAKVWNPPRSKRFNKSSTYLTIQQLMSLGLESINLKMIYRTKENMFSQETLAQGKGPLWMEGGSPSLIRQ